MKDKIVITNDGSYTIFNSSINECYHSKHGAIIEAEHVFIKNGFSYKRKNSLNILEVGFGTGLNALLTYQKAEQRQIKVNYHAIELFPVKKEVYLKLNFTDLIGLKQEELLKLHNCKWDKENKISTYFKLIKHHTSLEKYKTKKKFDIIYFDAFSPEKQPELWKFNTFKKMHGFLKSDGFLTTYCAKGIVKRTMKEVGFDVLVLDGPPGKRQMTKCNKINLTNK